MVRKDANITLNCLRIQPEIDPEMPLQKRIARCTDEINKVLEKYGLTLEILNDINLVPSEGE